MERVEQGDLALFQNPAAQQMLHSKIPARVAYVWTDGTPRVVIINRTMAQRLFPNEDPLGKRIKFSDAPEVPWKEVVGTMDTIRSLASDANHDEIKVALKVKEDQPKQ